MGQRDVQEDEQRWERRRLFSVSTVMSGNLILDALSSDVVASLRARLITFDAGQILHEPGDESPPVVFPRKGTISLMTPLLDGAIETSVVGREGAVGHFAALNGRPVRSQVMTQLPGEGWAVNRETFTEAIEAYPALRHAFERYAEQLLTEAYQEIACRSVHRVDTRLARWLLEIAERAGTESLSLSQEFIASQMRVQRTTINTAARALRVDGAIRYTRGHIHLTDLERLARHACSCHATLRRYRMARSARAAQTAIVFAISPEEKADAKPFQALSVAPSRSAIGDGEERAAERSIHHQPELRE